MTGIHISWPTWKNIETGDKPSHNNGTNQKASAEHVIKRKNFDSGQPRD